MREFVKVYKDCVASIGKKIQDKVQLSEELEGKITVVVVFGVI